VSAEVKVGIVVVLGAVMLAVAAYYLSPQWGWRRGGEEVIAYFDDSQGITPGTSVRLSGILIGQVAEVGLSEDGQRAKLWIRIDAKDAMLYEGQRLRIDAGGLLGERFVNVIGEPSAPRRRLDYSNVPTEASIGVGQLVSETGQLVRTVNDVAARIGDVVGDPQIIADMRGAVGELHGLTADLRAQIAEGRIERILNELAGTSVALRTKLEGADIEGVINKLDEAAEAGRQVVSAISAEDIQSAVGNMRAMTENVRAASEELRSAVTEAGLLADAQATMASMRRISADLEATAKDLRQQLTDEQRIKRVDAILANAEQVTARAVKISEELEETVASGKEVAGDARVLIGDIRQGIRRPTEALEKLVVDPRAELTVGARSGNLQLDTDLFFGNEGSPSQLVLGMRDLGDTTDLNLQFAHRMSDDIRIRGGLIGGDVGGAVDMQLVGPWGLTAEAYERPRQWRIDLTGAYDFGTGLSGLLGFDNILGATDPFIGVRYIPPERVRAPKAEQPPQATDTRRTTAR
jgi:ABC-type transporter Mla subunit MlaD